MQSSCPVQEDGRLTGDEEKSGSRVEEGSMGLGLVSAGEGGGLQQPN